MNIEHPTSNVECGLLVYSVQPKWTGTKPAPVCCLAGDQPLQPSGSDIRSVIRLLTTDNRLPSSNVLFSISKSRKGETPKKWFIIFVFFGFRVFVIHFLSLGLPPSDLRLPSSDLRLPSSGTVISASLCTHPHSMPDRISFSRHHSTEKGSYCSHPL